MENTSCKVAAAVSLPLESVLARLSEKLRAEMIEASKKSSEFPIWNSKLASIKSKFLPSASIGSTLKAMSETLAYSCFHRRIIGEIDATKHELLKANSEDFLSQTQFLVSSSFSPPEVKSAFFEIDKMLENRDYTDLYGRYRRFKKEDPSLYFFEEFLREVDPLARKKMGVYFTPRVVVDFIVSGSASILAGFLPDGMHSRELLILDPACGTGAFLGGVIENMRRTWPHPSLSRWQSFVESHVSRRVCGFEIMPSSYSSALAHVRETFWATGISSNDCPTPSVFLTDTLEQTARRSKSICEGFESKDSESAKRVHEGSSFPLIIGNPPYRQFSENKGEWIDALMNDYKVGLVERKHNVDNDYVKFLRFASWRVEEEGRGMVAFITPNTHLNAPTFRVMREHLLRTFDEIYVIDLHGSAMMESHLCEGKRDENVFDIRQGVCISFFLKTRSNSARQNAKLRYFSLQGSREDKLSWMKKTQFDQVPWQDVVPDKQMHSFVPRPKVEDCTKNQREQLSLDSIFGCRSSGIQTKNDKFLYTKTRQELISKIEKLATLSEEQIRELFPEIRESSGWSLARAMQHAKNIVESGVQKNVVRQVFYRPYELRWTVLTDEGAGLVGRPRFDVMRLFFSENIKKNFGLVTTRQLSSCEFSHAWVADMPIDGNAISQRSREYNVVFPLFIDDGLFGWAPNITPLAVKMFEDSTGLTFSENSNRSAKHTFDSLDLFSYVYGVLWNPEFREAENAALRNDFARIPMPTSSDDFFAVVVLGGRLIKLHVSGDLSDTSANVQTNFVGENRTCESAVYHFDSRRLAINSSSYFEGISPEAWGFRVGAFSILRKWLSDREFSKTGVELTSLEISQFMSLVEIANSTLQISAQLRLH